MAGVNKGTVHPKHEICGHCNTYVAMGIQCDCCQFWAHYKCESISEAEAKVWEKLGSRAKFYCSVRNCEQIADQFITSLKPLQEQVDINTRKIEANACRIEQLENRLTQQENIKKDAEAAVNQALEQVKTTVEAEKINLKSVVKDEMSAVIQEQKNAIAASGSELVDKISMKVEVKAAIEDERDKEFRARNLFLAGVPEPDTDDLDIGKAADLENITNILSTHMKLEKDDFKIDDTTRIFGGKESSGDPGKPRLLRVRFANPEMVGRVARASPNLLSSDDPVVKKVRVFRDRSKKEREERKKLLVLAERNNNEEQEDAYKWVVDFDKKEVHRVLKETTGRKMFRQRKYR